MWLYRDKWQTARIKWAAMAVFAGVCAYLGKQALLGELLAVAPLVVLVGNASTPVLRQFGRFGDLSYGVYVYAFVVQQTLAWHYGNSLSFEMQLLSTTAITLLCAWLSWHLIEKPALSLKSANIFRWPMARA